MTFPAVVHAPEVPVEVPAPDQTRRYPLRHWKRNPRYYNDDMVNVQYQEQRKVRFGELNNAFLNSLDWNDVTNVLQSKDAARFAKATEIYFNHDLDEYEWFHPLSLAVKANAEDNPRWNEAMNGPDADGYWDAMKSELKQLEDKSVWEVVSREHATKVLPSTWTFKCKRYPDGSVRKLKARFCARGDCQIEGVDFFDTYAPVVSWTTVRTLLVLSIVLGLCTKQVDYTLAFCQAPIDTDVYVEMPRGFAEKGKVLKLRRSLYGLRQSPKNFFQHLKEKLEKCDFRQSQSDPCLFISDNVIVLVYVDDCLFYSPRSENIDSAIAKLKALEMDLHYEDDVAGFLGVHIDRKTNGTIELTQKGLIERVISAMGLEGATPKATPAESGALPSDASGDPCDENFNYRSVVGMLMYLSSNTRPDLTFAVHQCARFSHRPRRSHEQALKRIGRYLVGTKTKGLILTPNAQDLRIDMYVDADFAGLWSYENPDDPASVKSRTGFVILIGGCPVIWTSKLQVETALSTMQAEYVALSTAMRDLLPFRSLAIEICTSIGLEPEKLSTIKSTIWEDNVGALTLANLELPRITPKSKHFAVKYHWFREQLIPGEIEIVRVDTHNQLADVFTKGLSKEKFENLRGSLLGW
jgi:hypothetical protein